ncbi:MAG: secretion protein HlyD, partial [Lacunisphaera sp.]|nr:secretion protein HlyD [Lacunisphaera sp.]
MKPAIASPGHPAAIPTPDAPVKTRARPSRRSLTKPLVIGVVAAAAVVWGARFGWHAWHYVETDNAYITGHLHQVSAQIDGQVKEVLVIDNQDVKAGAPLVRLDPLEFEIALQKATAAVAQAKAQEAQAEAVAAQADAQFAEATARVAQAGAGTGQVRAQLDLAQRTAARNEQLFKDNGAVTQADVDTSRSALNAAQAGVDASAANHAAAEAAVNSAQAARKSAAAQASAAAANVAAAEAALHDAQRQLTYATLTAPADGRVGNKNVEAGNRVSAGQVLLALTEPAPWIVANFKETQLPRIVVGQSV